MCALLVVTNVCLYLLSVVILVGETTSKSSGHGNVGLENAICGFDRFVYLVGGV